MSIICPITKEEITGDYGLTMTGSIYSYDAIEIWLKFNFTDPLTNIIIPNTITKYSAETDIEIIKDESNKLKETYLYKLDGKFLLKGIPYSTNKINEIIEIKNSLSGKLSWLKYCKAKAPQLISSEKQKTSVFFYYDLCSLDKSPLDKDDEIIRPNGYGYGFEFVNFSSFLRQKEKRILDADFKMTSFNGANISGFEFVDCKFSECAFIATNIQNTVFINCSFEGLSTVFFSSEIDNKTKFFNCTVSNYNASKIYNSHEKRELFQQIMHMRGLNTTLP